LCVENKLLLEKIMEKIKADEKVFKKVAVLVGCGGVAYHFLMLLTKLMYDLVICVDSDIVEESNVRRQWGQVGAKKDLLCATALKMLGVGAINVPMRLSKDNCESILGILPTTMTTLDVFAFTDNNVGRVAAHRLWMMCGKGRAFITAGNDMTGGQAIGWTKHCEKVPAKYLTVFDTEGEKPDGTLEVEVAGCGTIEQQSKLTNAMTAQCIARVCKDLENPVCGPLSAWYWMEEEKQDSSVLFVWDDVKVGIGGVK
jgi:hypothetical protein